MVTCAARGWVTKALRLLPPRRSLRGKPAPGVKKLKQPCGESGWPGAPGLLPAASSASPAPGGRLLRRPPSGPRAAAQLTSGPTPQKRPQAGASRWCHFWGPFPQTRPGDECLLLEATTFGVFAVRVTNRVTNTGTGTFRSRGPFIFPKRVPWNTDPRICSERQRSITCGPPVDCGLLFKVPSAPGMFEQMSLGREPSAPLNPRFSAVLADHKHPNRPGSRILEHVKDGGQYKTKPRPA